MTDPAGQGPVHADHFVRPARQGDVAALADVQLRVFRESYGELLPASVLVGLDDATAEAAWREAVTQPPSPRHRVLVAVETGRLVGFAATAPAGDDDLDPAVDAEIRVLLVLPERQRAGHGSRLLAAAVDTLVGDSFTSAVAWVPAGDPALRAFYGSAGWAEDATRELADETGQAGVGEVRLQALIGGAWGGHAR